MNLDDMNMKTFCEILDPTSEKDSKLFLQLIKRVGVRDASRGQAFVDEGNTQSSEYRESTTSFGHS